MILTKGTCTKSGLLLRYATILPIQGLVLNLNMTHTPHRKTAQDTAIFYNKAQHSPA